MVISEKKQASCKHARKVSHKKKCRSVSFWEHPSTGHRSGAGRLSKMPLSPILCETPAGASLQREEMSVDYMLSCPFPKVCLYLKELDTTRDCELISETILHFSMRIDGLPECPREDLPLAVYLFIEDTFGIQSRIELCARLHDEWNPSVIGVVFETIRMKYEVLKNDALLEGAEVRMRDNKDLKWIFDAMSTY